MKKHKKLYYVATYQLKQRNLLTITLVTMGFLLAGLLFYALSMPASSQINDGSGGGGYWSVQGNRILDENGNQVTIAAVNWFGMETDSFAPHGLWKRNYKEMLAQIRNSGFNALRIPYSNEMLNSDSVPTGIDYQLNPELEGKTPLEILDAVIDEAGLLGLKVILDRHRPTSDGQSDLWYISVDRLDPDPESYSEIRWIEDWKFLAERYKGNTTVIGADLHNEPHGPACWNCDNSDYNWKSAAERAANAIHEVHPGWLVFVAGVQAHNYETTWWGSNLKGVRDAPIEISEPAKVVYTVHDYPPSVASQPWFVTEDFPGNLPGVWDGFWGYIHKEEIAPVLVGEFGSRLETDSDRKWMTQLVKYLQSSDASLHWAYWSWNPNSGDTGGILKDDWETVDTEKLSALTPIMPKEPFAAVSPYPISQQARENGQPGSDGSPAPETSLLTETSDNIDISQDDEAGQSALLDEMSPEQTRDTDERSSNDTLLEDSSGKITTRCSFEVVNEWSDGYIAEVSITNTSNDPINGWVLSWQFPSSQEVINLWNGEVSQSGNAVTVQNATWNKGLPSGTSTTFGFQALGQAVESIPSEMLLNGTPCQLASTTQE